MASEPEVAAGLPCRGREHQRCLRLAVLGLGYSECRDRSGKGVEEGGGGAPETTLETRGSSDTPEKRPPSWGGEGSPDGLAFQESSLPLAQEGQSVSSPPPDSMTRFLGSLRARLMLLHPSPNCSLRAESLVHVHFKEEIGIAELIPLVTTYIILFAYIYFSTRGSTAQGLGAFSKLSAHSRPPAPHLWKWLGQRCRTCPVLAKARASSSRTVSGLGGSRPSWASREKTLPGLGFLKDTPFP